MTPPRRTLYSALARTAERINLAVDRHKWIALTLVLGLFALSWLAFAARIPFWIDEIFTFYMVALPDFPSIMKAIMDGADQAAPLYYLTLRPLAALFGAHEFILRLPSVAGFCVMCAAIYYFAAKRYPAVYGFIAMLFTANVGRPYAAYARPYSIEWGALALALVFWQAGASGVRRKLMLPLLFLALSVAIAFHVFAVFALLPLLAGEAVRFWRTKRVDLAIAAAICLPTLVLIPHRFLLQSGRQFTAHFFSRPTFPVLWGFFLSWEVRYMLPLLLVIPLLALGRGYLPRVVAAPSERRGMPAHEWTAVVVWALSPLLIFLVSRIFLHVFVDRYVLWTAMGTGLAIAGVLFRVAPRDGLAVCVAALFWFGMLASIMSAKVLRPHYISVDTQAAAALLPAIPAKPKMILFASDSAAYVLWHYADPSLRNRIVYPVDIAAHLRYLGFDTSARLAQAWRTRIDLKLPDLGDFLRSNQDFLVVGEPTDWLNRYLGDHGYSPRRIGEPAMDWVVYEYPGLPAAHFSASPPRLR